MPKFNKNKFAYQDLAKTRASIQNNIISLHKHVLDPVYKCLDQLQTTSLYSKLKHSHEQIETIMQAFENKTGEKVNKNKENLKVHYDQLLEDINKKLCTLSERHNEIPSQPEVLMVKQHYLKEPRNLLQTSCKHIEADRISTESTIQLTSPNIQNPIMINIQIKKHRALAKYDTGAVCAHMSLAKCKKLNLTILTKFENVFAENGFNRLAGQTKVSVTIGKITNQITFNLLDTKTFDIIIGRAEIVAFHLMQAPDLSVIQDTVPTTKVSAPPQK